MVAKRNYGKPAVKKHAQKKTAATKCAGTQLVSSFGNCRQRRIPLHVAIRGLSTCNFEPYLTTTDVEAAMAKKAETKKSSTVRKPAKKKAFKITKASSVIGQLREPEWIGQHAKGIEFESQAVNLFQILED